MNRGPSIINRSDLIETIDPPLPRYAHISHIVNSQLVTMWGGGTGTGTVLNEIYALDFETKKWQQQKVEITRSSLATVYTPTMICPSGFAASAAVGNRIYIFGGLQSKILPGNTEISQVVANQFVVYDHEKRTLERIVQREGDVWPDGRFSGSLTYFDEKNCLFLLGGVGSKAVTLNDLYCYHLHSKRWEKIYANDPPIARVGHSAQIWLRKPKNTDTRDHYDRREPYLVVYGGSDDPSKDNCVLSDLIMYDIKQNRWIYPRWNMTNPPARYMHTAVISTSKMIVFGGVGLHSGNASECLCIRLGLDYLRLDDISLPDISSRSSHTISPIGDQCFIFGGRFWKHKFTNELWRLEIGLPQLKYINVYSKRGILYWNDSSDLLNNHAYRVLIKRDPKDSWTVYEGTERQWKMTGLVNGVSYTAEVYASNSVGFTRYSREHTFQFQEIPDAPTNAKAKIVGSDVIFEWQSPDIPAKCVVEYQFQELGRLSSRTRNTWNSFEVTNATTWIKSISYYRVEKGSIGRGLSEIPLSLLFRVKTIRSGIDSDFCEPVQLTIPPDGDLLNASVQLHALQSTELPEMESPDMMELTEEIMTEGTTLRPVASPETRTKPFTKPRQETIQVVTEGETVRPLAGDELSTSVGMASTSSTHEEEAPRLIKKPRKSITKPPSAESVAETAPITKTKSDSRPTATKKSKETPVVKKAGTIDESRREEIRRQMLGDRMPERRADRPVERRPVPKKDKPAKEVAKEVTKDQSRALKEDVAGAKEVPSKKKNLHKHRPAEDQLEYVSASKEATPKKSADRLSIVPAATEKAIDNTQQTKLDTLDNLKGITEDDAKDVKDAKQSAHAMDEPPVQSQELQISSMEVESKLCENPVDTKPAPTTVVASETPSGSDDLKAKEETMKAAESPMPTAAHSPPKEVAASTLNAIVTPKAKGRKLVKKSTLNKSPSKLDDLAASKKAVEVDDESSAASLNPEEDPKMSSFRSLICQRNGKSRGLAYNLKYGEKLQVYWEDQWWHAVAVLYAFDDSGELFLKVHFLGWPESDDHYLNVKDGHLLIRDQNHKLMDTGPANNRTKFQFSLSRDKARSHYGILEGDQYDSAKKFKYLLTPLMEEPRMLRPSEDE